MQIDINFRVFKKLTEMRPDETTTYDDVLCDLLKLPREPKGARPATPGQAALIRKEVAFPSGTPLQATHKGRRYSARIVDGKIFVDGVNKDPTVSFSRAAGYITGNNVNGWSFWKCKRPQDSEFVPLNSLRKDK